MLPGRPFETEAILKELVGEHKSNSLDEYEADKNRFA